MFAKPIQTIGNGIKIHSFEKIRPKPALIFKKEIIDFKTVEFYKTYCNQIHIINNSHSQIPYRIKSESSIVRVIPERGIVDPKSFKKVEVNLHLTNTEWINSNLNSKGFELKLLFVDDTKEMYNVAVRFKFKNPLIFGKNFFQLDEMVKNNPVMDLKLPSELFRQLIDSLFLKNFQSKLLTNKVDLNLQNRIIYEYIESCGNKYIAEINPIAVYNVMLLWLKAYPGYICLIPPEKKLAGSAQKIRYGKERSVEISQLPLKQIIEVCKNFIKLSNLFYSNIVLEASFLIDNTVELLRDKALVFENNRVRKFEDENILYLKEYATLLMVSAETQLVEIEYE
ncbi:MAG: hypothetical protein MHPSP_003264 [Paramarteilia canceri]